jgi:sterol desaturase/sphingolipid hydroxylase (fatty acid hydroxylase superfamily)
MPQQSATCFHRLQAKVKIMKLGKAFYFGDFVAIPLAISGLAGWVLPGRGMVGAAAWMASVAVGLLVWTFVEYIVHRWVFHVVPFFEKYHDAHHAEPLALIGVPSFASMGIILAGFFLAPLALAGALFASGFASGALLGYAAYMAVHHAVHHMQPKPGGMLYRARLRHMAHHYHGAGGNYGVTTGVWDYLFATVLEGRRRVAPI